ncbi:sugar ABC transporter substrate-binding protein [Mesorhizobium sp. ANAO-SY3R2]|uniref:sugar ABC transporter substrate-binding protein n=1 Tax=Mesorhizobium sp. ANAO-SY3R2 TaxID=3166644 RepID=UPI00366BFB4E
MNRIAKLVAGTMLCVGLGTGMAAADGGGFDDGMSATYHLSMKGKKVVFVPISIGMDIAAGFAAGMQRMANEEGFDFQIRDPNWNIDQGVQAITQIIDEKPDLIVVQNVDMQAYARVLKQAMEAGVRVLQVNVKATTNTTSHVGIDWYKNAETNALKLVEKCSPKNGGNGKIAVLQGTPNNPTNFIGMKAFKDVMAANPEMAVVSDQAADWDASKAHSVVSTVIRQNPDLCGYFGLWDGQDSGLAAAVREAGLTGKVFVVSQGAGEKAACDKIKDGSYDFYVSYNINEISKRINDSIAVILQHGADETVRPFAIYMNSWPLTKANLSESSCWTLDQIKAGL